ncbi:UDP-N-acetylmuramate dehydrogenase [Pseudomarimonas salicorniae]|uniref:UDP-N-acetylenolpyruvoylglucosamine reductase n=1 Tax=Pseudomarimonas salicorniae TaxID=2933270 RepID=A0ABT0GGG0_9GAMM|nr:UDP-N-acetylmuramate dehydrogenase [Lysobacter sp. CAU 1642]MCK7593142.1 UDP-N-acetylmuramate dehydrogenase [Lysobacter sp. CAU 1642]
MDSLPEMSGYLLRENAPLQARNTFGVPATADLLAEVRSLEGLQQLLDAPFVQGLPMLVLGEGSNLLLVGRVPGLVLSLGLPGLKVIDEDAGRVRVLAEAGERWDDLVRWSVGRGLHGLENMALIPGSVGACPIQNIGAYGADVSQTLAWVEAWDLDTRRLRRLDRTECAFGYRDSRFKRESGRWIILRVAFDLQREAPLRLDYPGVREELAVIGVDPPRPLHVAEAISRIRARKLPLPALLGNAGSFFKNPEIPGARIEAMLERHPGMPNWPAAEGQVKLSAGWLIEQAGWRGFREGDAGVAEQHALVLVNHGRADGAQILELARRIAASVRERFGVDLEPEPRLVGASW